MIRIEEIIQSPVFAKQKKKLNKNQIGDLDEAIRSIADDPSIGHMKTGDLQGIQVFKFKCNRQEILLAYEISGSRLFLYAFGSHENFYRHLKKYLLY
jgi:mRNA interferase RelE/StbE